LDESVRRLREDMPNEATDGRVLHVTSPGKDRDSHRCRRETQDMDLRAGTQGDALRNNAGADPLGYEATR
jgi:hypothetical protein